MTARWQTTNWQDGDAVTLEALGHVLTGRVVVRGRAVRVQYTDLAGRARNEWPDGWAIGTGSRSDRCIECGNTFRSDDTTEVFCLPCNRLNIGQTCAGYRVNRDYVGGRRRVG